MQQINLYQASIRKPREQISLNQVTIVAAGLVLALTLVSSAQWWLLQHKRQRFKQAHQNQIVLRQEIARLSQRLEASRHDNKLKKAVEEKQAELRQKQRLVKTLNGRQFGNTHGFADQFIGLAKQHVKGVWLTGLDIKAGGEKMNLQGSTYEADLVPKYIRRLGKVAVFNGIEFQTFLMQRRDKSRQIDFDLRSTPREHEQ